MSKDDVIELGAALGMLLLGFCLGHFGSADILALSLKIHPAPSVSGEHLYTDKKDQPLDLLSLEAKLQNEAHPSHVDLHHARYVCLYKRDRLTAIQLDACETLNAMDADGQTDYLPKISLVPKL